MSGLGVAPLAPLARSLHSDLCFGKYTPATAAAMGVGVTEVYQNTFPGGARQVDSRDNNPAYVNTTPEETEFIIPGEPGTFVSGITVYYKKVYVQAHDNMTVKTKMDSGDLLGGLEINGSTFFGFDQDVSDQLATQAGKEIIGWAENTVPPLERKNLCGRVGTPQYRAGHVPQEIKRTTKAYIDLPVAVQIVNKPLIPVTAGAPAADTAAGAAVQASSRWHYSAMNETVKGGAGNTTLASVPLHEIMNNDALATCQLIPNHRGSTVRVRPNPRTCVSVSDMTPVDGTALAGADYDATYGLTISHITYDVHQCTDPAVVAILDAEFGDQYDMPATQIQGKMYPSVVGEENVGFSCDPGPGNLLLTAFTCQGGGGAGANIREIGSRNDMIHEGIQLNRCVFGSTNDYSVEAPFTTLPPGTRDSAQKAQRKAKRFRAMKKIFPNPQIDIGQFGNSQIVFHPIGISSHYNQDENARRSYRKSEMRTLNWECTRQTKGEKQRVFIFILVQN